MFKTYFALLTFSFFYLFFSVYIIPFFFKIKNKPVLVFLPRPSGSRPIRNLFKIDFTRNFFFFSNNDIDNFFYSFNPSFNINNIIINNSFSKIDLYYPPYRHFFFNYSIKNIYIFKIVKFSQHDFSNITFSDNFSYISGFFKVSTNKFLENNTYSNNFKFFPSLNSKEIITNINTYNFFFTFSVIDFSISIFFEYTDVFNNKNIIPCSFVTLSISDYKHFLDIFKMHLFKNYFFDINKIPAADYINFQKFVFSKFFSRIFSGIPLSIVISSFIKNIDFCSNNNRLTFVPIQKFVFSNLDSSCSNDNLNFDYFTLNYILTQNFYRKAVVTSTGEDILKIKSFSFYKIKL